MGTLRIKPHRVRVQRGVVDVDAVSLGVTPLDYSGAPGPSGAGLPCCIQPMTAVAAYEKYGVEMKQPSRLLCEVTDAARLQIGDRIIRIDTGAAFFARFATIHDANPRTAHAIVLLEAEVD